MSNDKSGYVYVIHETEANLYKIGITANMERRMRELKVGINATLIEHAHYPNARKIEALMHQMYSERRIAQTEYFKLAEAPVLPKLAAPAPAPKPVAAPAPAPKPVAVAAPRPTPETQPVPSWACAFWLIPPLLMFVVFPAWCIADGQREDKRNRIHDGCQVYAGYPPEMDETRDYLNQITDQKKAVFSRCLVERGYWR